VAIEQGRFAEPARQHGQFIRKAPMIGPVDFIDPSFEFRPIDPPTPEASVPMGSGRDKAQPVARPRTDRRRGNSLDRSRINLLFTAIAIDDSSGDVLDNGSKSSANRTPA
jgi:hypothetical protein